MISNFDVEKITNHYNINVIIAMKDELKHIKPISGNYIISLESSDMGNGTHWMALKIEDVHCVYFDSYGYLPPEEVITFCKRIKKSCLAYNTREIQDLSAETSGFFAIGFFLFLHIDTQDCLFKRSSCFSNLFPIDTISPYQMNHNAENLHVSFPNGLTMNILLQKTKNKMENSFLSYSARDDNCQNFVRAIIQSNGLSNSRNVLFTKQSTSDLFSKDLRKFTNTVTDIALKFDIIKDGGYLIY